MEFRRVTVIGCGLIGASFALALRHNGACESVLGWDISPSILDEALTLGVIDGVDTAWSHGTESESDLIYLAMPVGDTFSSCASMAHSSSPKQSLRTRAAPKSKCVARRATTCPKGVDSLAGIQWPEVISDLALSATLFEGATYVLTPCDGESRDGALDMMKRVVEKVGACVSLS